MKNFIGILSGIILVIFLFSGCQTQVPSFSETNMETFNSKNEIKDQSISEQVKVYDQDKMDEEIQKIINKGFLTVGLVSEDYKCFFETNEKGELFGIDIDLARNIAKSLGVQVKFDRTAETFTDLTDKLKHREIDMVIAEYSVTAERNMYVLQSDPYMSSHISVAVNKKFLVKNDIQENPIGFMKKNPINLCVAKGTAYSDMAKDLFPKANVIYVDTTQEACEKVINDEVDAVLDGEIEFLIISNKDERINIYMDIFSFSDIQDNFCVGIAKEAPQLLNYVNAYLQTSQKMTSNTIKELIKNTEGNQ